MNDGTAWLLARRWHRNGSTATAQIKCADLGTGVWPVNDQAAWLAAVAESTPGSLCPDGTRVWPVNDQPAWLRATGVRHARDTGRKGTGRRPALDRAARL